MVIDIPILKNSNTPILKETAFKINRKPIYIDIIRDWSSFTYKMHSDILEKLP